MGNEPHIETWNSRLLRLSDGAFLDLMRNYLGKVETPYNKHDLIKRLNRYLRGEEVRDAIIAAIDEEDARTITAVSLLSRPTLADLSDLFPESVSFLTLHERLRNLEDRLLLFRDLDTEVLYVNPILEERLARSVLDPSLLIEVRPAPDEPPPRPWLSDGLCLALISAAADSIKGAAVGRALTRRELSELGERIPPVAEHDGNEISELIRAFASLGLLETQDGALEPNLSELHRFADLSYSERLALVVGALVGEAGHPDEATADAVVALVEELSPENEYRDSALRVIHHLRTRRRLPWESIANHLLRLGILTASDDGWLRPSLLDDVPREGGALMVQAGNEITLGDTARFSEGLPVALCAFLRRHDIVGTYEVTRESIAMADQHGFPIQELPAILAELATRELPQSLAFNLQSWLSERSKLNLTYAAVLTVDEDRRAFLDGNDAFQDYVLSCPAPGVYLLDPRRESQWRRLLGDLGFPHLPRKQSRPTGVAVWAKPQAVGESSRLRGLLGSRVLDEGSDRGSAKRPQSGRRSRTRGNEKQTSESLLKTLEKKELPPEVAKELALRIEKKLILFPEQLAHDIGSRDRQEARGLDYVGKVRVIEQAIREGDETLELFVRRGSGEPVQMQLRPAELEKRGNRLILKGHRREDEEHVSVPVEKISLVRRLRGFLISR